MIEAVTFDFWDTIAVDDSDEAKRKALGLPGKAQARIQLFAEHVTRRYPQVSAEAAADAWCHANERFRSEWHGNHHTPAVSLRVSYAFEYLGLLPPPGGYGSFLAQVDGLVSEIELMEVRIPPDFVPGIGNALYLLSQQYKLGIISDTIHTHGRGLRHLLNAQGLLHFFSAAVFSDEVGASKPSTTVFRHAAMALDVPPSRIAHVGDRESNDVAGPRAMGFRTILYTGAIDRGSTQTAADAVCRHMNDLALILQTLR